MKPVTLHVSIDADVADDVDISRLCLNIPALDTISLAYDDGSEVEGVVVGYDTYDVVE